MRNRLLTSLCVATTLAMTPSAGASPSATDVSKATSATVANAVQHYRWFHANPELSNQEVNTAAHLAAAMAAKGLTVHTGIGGHGLVAVLRSKTGADKGPVVLYRADMDGLPVVEETGVAYASNKPGVMHACGHDVHMATAIGVMEALVTLSDQWQGTVVFVGQPAEELGSGARAMLDDKRFKKILADVGGADVAIALHDAADLPAGDVSIIEGFHHANVDAVDIVIHGKGGHGARPHETIDPIVIAAEVVMSLQTIVSRRLRPDDKAVVTVGKFEAGTKHNIIPPKATLLLTVRSYSDETRALLLKEIGRIARQIAKAHRAPRAPDITVSKNGLPAAYNDPAWTRRIRTALVSTLGESHVKVHKPSLGGEDFGLFPRALKIPGIMYKLGGVDPKRWKKTGGKGLPGLHSGQWAPAPKATVQAGIETITAAILEALRPGTSP
ncbi:MAG: amidohydrolase [Myxococcota bacterium]